MSGPAVPEALQRRRCSVLLAPTASAEASARVNQRLIVGASLEGDANGTADGGSFGFATATDGASTVLVGSYTAFGNATNSGAVYLLRQNEVLLADGFEGSPR